MGSAGYGLVAAAGGWRRTLCEAKLTDEKVVPPMFVT